MRKIAEYEAPVYMAFGALLGAMATGVILMALFKMMGCF